MRVAPLDDRSNPRTSRVREALGAPRSVPGLDAAWTRTRRRTWGLRTAALLFVCLAAARTPLAAQDDWFAKDKAQHFFASAAIATGGYAFGVSVWECKRPRAWFGFGLSFTAGTLKEWSDSRGNGQASWKDMAWNLLGIASALVVAWRIDDDPADCVASEPTRARVPGSVLTGFMVPGPIAPGPIVSGSPGSIVPMSIMPPVSPHASVPSPPTPLSPRPAAGLPLASVR